MKFDLPLLEGRFQKRYKRFFADVEMPDGSTITAHCPNTGSLLGCKDPGSRALLRDSGDPKRKLRYSWQAIEVAGTWVNVDTNLPNRVVFEAIQAGEIPELTGYSEFKREVKYGENSRIDVMMAKANGERCYVEVKNTTMVEGQLALFPDAVTSRGLKHLGELQKLAEAGTRAVQFFFISRCDVKSFRPADAIDPEYSCALRRAFDAGVEVMAWSTRVSPEGVTLYRSLKLDLEGPREYIKVKKNRSKA
jgi:sugar fermentation stimulation protein A